MQSKSNKTERAVWFTNAYVYFVQQTKGSKDVLLLGEDVRRIVRKKMPEPHHPNVWGSLVRCLAKDGYIEPTGRFRRMTTEKSHGRITMQYRVL